MTFSPGPDSQPGAALLRRRISWSACAGHWQTAPARPCIPPGFCDWIRTSSVVTGGPISWSIATAPRSISCAHGEIRSGFTCTTIAGTSSGRLSYSDHADTAWTTHCLDSAARTFERCFGEPPRRASQGGYFVTDAVVDRAVALGIEVDVTAEPGLEALHDGVTFGAYTTAPSPDFRQYPRRPYYPSRADLGSPATSATDARPLLMVPLRPTTTTAPGIHGTSGSPPRTSGLPRQPLPSQPMEGVAESRRILGSCRSGRRRGAGALCRVCDQERCRRLARHTFAPGCSSSICRRHPISRRLRFVDPLSPEIRALVAPYSRRSARPVSLSSGARGG